MGKNDNTLEQQPAGLRKHPYFRRLDSPGYLEIRGEDRVAFLQRQTTNDVRLLTEDQSLLTVLTSATARIMDVLILVQKGDMIVALTLPGIGGQTYRFLKSRIFFMDKVTITDRSADHVQLRFSHMDEAGLRQLVGGNAIIAVDLSNELRLALPQAEIIALETELNAQGIFEIDPVTAEILRVETGQPLPGVELNELYTPLEINLDAFISNNKGCYTGQEIIARQITYDKVTRRLVGLRLNGKATPGARILSGDTPAGEITSIAQSPHFGWIALAVVKRPYHEIGAKLTINDPQGDVIAIVAGLPFE